MTQDRLQPAFVLHTRPFRDSSLLVDLLSTDLGLVRCVARGARQGKRRREHSLQPFSPLLVELLGRGDLKTLGRHESAGAPNWLKGKCLYAGLYANELMVRLLPVAETNVQVFAAYQQLLQQLVSGEQAMEAALRRFEVQLLDSIGFLPPLTRCNGDTLAIEPQSLYALVPDSGFRLVAGGAESQRYFEYHGKTLLAMAAGDYSDEGVLQEAKRLVRNLLAPHLGDRPLQSRELFRQVYDR
ncbi:DNA repair protein RecO [Biformimicrobium ophioploci]|uniref:DNA repair protein RecO n=1 Tax=Biformimicrobium ophioploci TaxID=3036711 RepID=A0ABQ6LZX1_9GAMM|nr:DNA repair protein RecO [Microbulbifer sp. NKW57]GMG87601.1 DNA repair protein RecO [Microbulbifer sp. NKW57]